MVARRTREFGVRIALGAQQSDVVAMVLRQGMRLVAAGSAIGLALALAAGRLLTRLLYGVSPVDPVSFGGAILLLAVVGLTASVVPARRATYVDWGRAFFGLTVLFLGRLAWTQYWAAEDYRIRFTPKFRLQFDGADWGGTYIQERGTAAGLERRYRICVVNESETDIGPLHAEITFKDPSDADVWLHRRLHPMAEPRDSHGEFTVARQGRRFIEVVRELHPDSPADSQIAIIYNSNDLEPPIKSRNFQITLQVEGGSAPAQSMTLRIGAESFGRFPLVRVVD